MTLNVDVEVLRGDFVLDATLEVAPGETLALLGPNGSGKSTLLATIAGLLAPHRGTVIVNGRMLTDADGSAQYRATPPHRRKMGLLGQDSLLFPHLSALENIAFGMRSAGMKAEDARARAHQWLMDVGLGGPGELNQRGEPGELNQRGELGWLGDRRPAELSGGQQQRVAIARVLATEPDVLLLDEPMAALDVENAALLRSLLRKRLSQSKIATIVVTHDVVDALVLADRVAILDSGHIVDCGETRAVLGQPVNGFAAKLAGVNFLQSATGNGEVECRAFPPTAVRIAVLGTGMSTGTGTTTGTEPGSESDTGAESDTGMSPGSDSAWRSSATGVTQSLGSRKSMWVATVARLESAVRGVRVTFVGETVVAELSAAELLASGIREGTVVKISVDPAFVTVYPARSLATVRGG